MPDELDGAIASTGFAVLRPPDYIHPEFLLLALMSPAVIQQCMEAMKGAHYPALKVAQLKGLRIKIPNTLDEQKRIADVLLPELSALTAARIAATGQAAQMLDALKDSEFGLLAGDWFQLEDTSRS